jgi:hypothetical protein
MPSRPRSHERWLILLSLDAKAREYRNTEISGVPCRPFHAVDAASIRNICCGLWPAAHLTALATTWLGAARSGTLGAPSQQIFTDRVDRSRYWHHVIRRRDSFRPYSVVTPNASNQSVELTATRRTFAFSHD